jgi:hypothetical protein
MALWKPFRGNRTALEAVEKHDGFVYFCIDDGSLFFDYTDAAGVLQRKRINAEEAEKLTGFDIKTILNNSNVEIPTSKAVLEAIEGRIPSCSSSNNGQFLRVVNGIATWSTIPDAKEGSF